MHTAVRGHARELNLNPDDMKQLVRAEESFMKKMNEFELDNKAALRRVQATFLREAQTRDAKEVEDVGSRVAFDATGTETLDAVLAQLGGES
ncbi:hypothetical protein RFUL19S_04526 [Rhizobacter fulvus]